MNTQEMLEALSLSRNVGSAKIANDILQGRDTVANQKTICGKFFQHVYDGKLADAFRIATGADKHALFRWLIEKDRQADADLLIKKQYFNKTE